MDASLNPARVLFLCTHNSARSQMAEGLLRQLSDGRITVSSAGTIATTVRLEAISVMLEIGIDISHQSSKTLDTFVEQSFDLVITVCDAANQQCPTFPSAKHRQHWSIADPAAVQGNLEDRLQAFRIVRDELLERIHKEFRQFSGDRLAVSD